MSGCGGGDSRSSPIATPASPVRTRPAAHPYEFRSPTFGDRFDAASSTVTPPKTPPKTPTHPEAKSSIKPADEHRRFADHMSCVYNSQSPSGKTILITTTSSRSCNSSPARVSGSGSAEVIGPSSQQITIFTHHHHHNGPADNSAAAAAAVAASAAMEAAAAAAGGSKPTASAGGSVGINILINNHFNEVPPAPKASAKESPVHVKLESDDAEPKPVIRIKSETRSDGDDEDVPATADRTAAATSPKDEAAVEAGQRSDTTTTTTTTVTVTSNADAAGTTFAIGDEVFVCLTDDRFHLGRIAQLADNRCLVRFPDGHEQWSLVVDLQSIRPALAAPTSWTVCIVCKTTGAMATQKCAQCSRAYHPDCAGVDADGVWKCRRGHRNETEKFAAKMNVDEQTQSQAMPYDLADLNWDANHLRNAENTYCYCGGAGDWFREMLQCGCCKQWFHEKCIADALTYPLYLGDRFYVFACKLCNGGKEFVRRLLIPFEDVVHLLLLNLHLHNQRRRFFDVFTVIVPHAIDNWHTLQLSTEQRTMSYASIRESIAKCLASHPKRFRQRARLTLSSDSNGSSEYALCCRTEPPPAPFVDLATMNSSYWPLVDNALVQLCERNQNKAIQLLERTKPIEDLLRFSEEMRFTMSGRAFMKGKAPASVVESPAESEADDNDREVLAAMWTERGSATDCVDLVTPTNVYDYCTEREDSLVIPSIAALRCIDSGTEMRSTASASPSSSDSMSLPDVVPIADDSNDSRPEVLSMRNKRKRGGRPIPSAVAEALAEMRPHAIRGALDLMIPPLCDPNGLNNPFLGLTTSVIVQTAAPTKGRPRGKGRGGSSSAGGRNVGATVPAGTGAAAFGGAVPNGQVRLVRTIKRRLSAKDLLIGPNMEVKRRKLLRPSAGNVIEIISTTAVPYKTKTAVPETREASLMPPPATPIVEKPTRVHGDVTSAYGGRQLRKRMNTNYSENRRSTNNNTATPAVVEPSTDATIGEAEAPASDSASLGSTVRTKDGTSFIITAKRRGPDGLVQYLIEPHVPGSLPVKKEPTSP